MSSWCVTLGARLAVEVPPAVCVRVCILSIGPTPNERVSWCESGLNSVVLGIECLCAWVVGGFGGWVWW